MSDVPDSADVWLLADLKTPWCLRTVVTLGIADLIADGTSEIEELAAIADCDTVALHRVMRHLSARGVFSELDYGTFALTEVGRQLLNPEIKIRLDLAGVGARFAGVWSTTPGYVRTGRSQYAELYGPPFWEDVAANCDIGTSFDELMRLSGPKLADLLRLTSGWNDLRWVVDVGGGTGALLASILRANPQASGTLVELSATASRSAGVFANAGVADRATAVSQSFFEPLPHGADLYILNRVIDDWPDGDAVTLLARCAEAAEPSGRVVVASRFPSGPPPRSLDIEMLLTGGRDRSLDEFRHIASSAGLKVVAETLEFVECAPHRSTKGRASS